MFKVSAGYAAAIAALWGSVVYLYQQVIEEQNKHAEVYSALNEKIGVLQGGQQKVFEFGQEVLDSVERAIILSDSKKRENETAQHRF